MLIPSLISIIGITLWIVLVFWDIIYSVIVHFENYYPTFVVVLIGGFLASIGAGLFLL